MEQPTISTVILSWNRPDLLKVTVESYLATVSVPYELTIVDNASTDSPRELIESVCSREPRVKAIFLEENLGGEAINLGFESALAPFLHVSECDIEYLPGWSDELRPKFDAFPELGQLSVFAPDPADSQGEIIWEKHSATPLTRGPHTIYVAHQNLTTTCILRRDLWDRGFRWSTYTAEEGSAYRFPHDWAASMLVRQLGAWVAWNDKHTAINWGHSIQEWQRDVEYYVDNYRNKAWMGEEGLRQRLLAHGYDLVNEGGRHKIIKLAR